ncbi:MAG: nitroreductase family protein [Bacteroidales bacterium]|nr:nitroreductase family protein [Bacteroidales bacterium]
MKKLFLAVVMAALILPVMAQKNKDEAKVASKPTEIKLPAPERKGGMPLYEALNNRMTQRKFADTPLDEQQLSNLLWCAGGVNREDGKLTSPTARNAQEIDIYVFIDKGVFLYVPKENVLKEILPEDHRMEISERSKMPAEAPVTLLFYANYDKMEGFDETAREFYGATDAGFVSQNVYLYCAANKLSTVVMGAINRDLLNELIPGDGKAILAQPVGYPAK